VEIDGDLFSETPWLSVPWYQGDPQAYLRIYGDGQALFIETTLKDETERLRLLETHDSVSLTIPRDREGRPLGIVLKAARRGQVFSIWAPFAGIPLEETEL
jgi:hypothetical protein